MNKGEAIIKNSAIMITGSNGTIGCDLVEMFAKENTVYAFYRTPNKFSESFRNPNVVWIQADLKNKIEAKIEPRFVIHGAVTHPFSNQATSLDYINSNILSFQNVIDFEKQKNIKTIFNLSSVVAYGSPLQDILHDDNVFVCPDLLGASKIFCEQMLLANDLNGFNLRLPGVLCYKNRPEQRPWLNSVISRMQKNEPVQIKNSDKLFNNIICTKEIFRFISSAVANDFTGKNSYNFSASEPIVIREMIENLRVSLGSKSKIEFSQIVSKHFIISSKKICEEFSYKIDNTVNIINNYSRYLYTG